MRTSLLNYLLISLFSFSHYICGIMETRADNENFSNTLKNKFTDTIDQSDV